MNPKPCGHLVLLGLLNHVSIRSSDPVDTFFGAFFPFLTQFAIRSCRPSSIVSLGLWIVYKFALTKSWMATWMSATARSLPGPPVRALVHGWETCELSPHFLQGSAGHVQDLLPTFWQFSHARGFRGARGRSSVSRARNSSAYALGSLMAGLSRGRRAEEVAEVSA